MQLHAMPPKRTFHCTCYQTLNSPSGGVGEGLSCLLFFFLPFFSGDLSCSPSLPLPVAQNCKQHKEVKANRREGPCTFKIQHTVLAYRIKESTFRQFVLKIASELMSPSSNFQQGIAEKLDEAVKSLSPLKLPKQWSILNAAQSC